VTGIVGLLRTVNPLLNRDLIKSILLSSDNTVACVGSDTRCGAGIPDAGKSIAAGLGGSAVANRLTPLFSFYSSEREDHVYTVVPQMGTASILGLLPPLSYTGNHKTFGSLGPIVSSFTWFPGVPTTICGFSPPCDQYYPRAMVSVFTTFKNPRNGTDLAPLYRLSWACPSSADPRCPNHEHTSHVYSTDLYGENWALAGYKVDGIEGYVFPKSAIQPPGSVKLCRKYYQNDVYNVVHDDYILFPGVGTNGTDCSASTDGYTPGSNYTQNVN
jgi:serine protease